MNAIIPLNIAALRVNNNDFTNVVKGFQGKTAMFSDMPWQDPTKKVPAEASTGDKIYLPLGTFKGNPLQSPADPLNVGMHLQWQLPDYFRKGTQPADGSNIAFPPAPNRWLVTRFLSFYDPTTQAYGKVTTKSWVVESDYLAPSLSSDQYGIIRPTISVPIPSNPAQKQQPYMFMGRVVDYSAWNPSGESPANYLPAYRGTDGKPLYLTSIGFVGSYFGSYYPECCSVFGFWDNFADVAWPGYRSLYEALKANVGIQFRTSYQISGWLNEATADPLATIDEHITDQYNAYLLECRKNHTDPELNPTDFFSQITLQKMKWTFNTKDVGFVLNESDHTIVSLDYPERTLSSGTSQEVVWNIGANPGTTYFLQSDNPSNVSVWNAQVDIAIGNSTEEAVAAMLKTDMGQNTSDQETLDNYEYLLDALQLGLLADLEKTPNKLIALEEALHSNAFSTFAAGYLWIIGSKEVDGNTPVDPDAEVTLPLDLAELVYLLNQAQKNYDMGRAALSTMRKQLFMDWTHYIKINTGEITDPNISKAAMTNFIEVGGGGELNAVVAKGNQVGKLSYYTDELSGAVSGIVPPPAPGLLPGSLALAVWKAYDTVRETLAKAKVDTWQLQCTQIESFYQPNEPLVLMQGDRMEPAARNGGKTSTFVRLSQEILNQLTIINAGTPFKVSAGALAGLPAIGSNTPMQADVQALVGEAGLITPMLASLVSTALAAQGGTNNPAVVSSANFITSLMYAQGGLSPLDVTPNLGGVPTPPAASLYALVSGEKYLPAANPVIQVTAPQALSVEFGNAADNGWPPNIIGWTTQSTPEGFPATQANPFLPIFMIWNVQLNPLQWETEDANGNSIYTPTNVTDFFNLDKDAVDYQYKIKDGKAADFTSPIAVPYGNSSTVTSNSTGVLVYQITSYIDAHPGDPDNPTLQAIADVYASKKFLAQSISGFNSQQVLNTFIAQVAIENLTQGTRDQVTTNLAAAASKNSWDNWYNFGFNSLQPISTDLQAQRNFGPLRSGFLEILSIEIVDAFGQRMDLATVGRNPDQSLQVITAYSMTPPEQDSANKGRIYLPPRILSPSRLWLQWLSATCDTSVAGITGDFEEMSRSPATSPVCGWVMPNHLDNNLFFYTPEGNPIGTFGVEHEGTSATLRYRTRAGNLGNPTSSLAVDIGPQGQPANGINPNLANYMWYLDGQDADYLRSLMRVILDSAGYINPANYSQNASLSVLIGRPLALTRAVAGLETAGNLLPLSQANTGPQSPLPQDVNNGRVNYTDRMQTSSANLQNVNFPLRMGDLANLDDGLVGYLIEGSGDNPYTGATFYAPAAGKDMQKGVRAPSETTIELQLNGAPVHLTMLVDPRAPVHATTAVLPVNELRIPPDQYSVAMSSLAVNFTTRPMLKMAQGLAVPLPAETGYGWSWITPGSQTTTELQANQVNETPVYGYTPQTLQEGWLELTPDE